MTLKAPTDRKSTKARVNWLLRMLPVDDDRVLIRAHWPGRSAPTTQDAGHLREDPTALQTDNPDVVPHSFEILLVERLGKRFPGRKTFVEDLERIVPAFYDLVAVNLKAWQAPAPKPIKLRELASVDDRSSAELEEGGVMPLGD